MKYTLIIFALYCGILAGIITGKIPGQVLSYILLFALSAAILMRSANMLTVSIGRMAKYLHWREFVIAFFVMAIGSSIPNLFVGISSALHNIPELSFGDIVGNNVVDLTIVAALAALFGQNLALESRMARTSSLLTAIVAVLPLFLILDGTLGRGDGIALILIFVFYSGWLLSKRKLYDKVVQNNGAPPLQAFRNFLWSIAAIVLGFVMIIFAAEGAVRSASFFAQSLGLPLVLIGILITGLGSAIPEIYFTIAAARKKQNWIILGELMGSIIVLSTAVLGIVAILRPIQVQDFSYYAIARIFLVIAATFFFVFIRTSKMLTKKESFVLVAVYIAFIATLFAQHFKVIDIF